MSKYGIGDKVVIRKDLIVGEVYGNWTWSAGKEYMKEKDYVVIERVNDGDYWVEDERVDDDYYWIENEWLISEEMIEGLYEEGKYSDPTLVEIITDFLNRLENAYDNKKFIPITTMHLLVLQRLVNDAGFNYKFKEISKINTK